MSLSLSIWCNDMQTVVFLSAFFLPSIGGLEKHIHKWAHILSCNGVSVFVYTTDMFHVESYTDDNLYSVIRFGDSLASWADSIKSFLIETCTNNTVYIIGSIGEDTENGILEAVFLAKKNGAKVLVNIPTADYCFRQMKRPCVRGIVCSADRLITVAPNVAAYTKYCSDVQYLPNYILDQDIPKESDPFPQNLTVAYIGRIAKRKRLTTIIDIAENMGNIQFFIQGAMSYGEEMYYSQIVQSFQNLDNVTILNESNQIAPEILNASIFLNPSRTEGCSNSLLEAMSRGAVPVVERIRENQILIPYDMFLPNSVAGYLKVLKFCCDDDNQKKIRSVQRRLRSHIVRNYSESALKEKIINYSCSYK